VNQPDARKSDGRAEDAADQPALKVKKPRVPAAALSQPQDDASDAAETGEGEKEAKEKSAKVVIPPLEGRYPYATHAPPPPESDEQGAGKPGAGTSSEREISTGFVLGVALIVVALAAGIFIAGLRKKVNRLESRVERLEQLVEAGNSG
jgi:hypothetical protein